MYGKRLHYSTYAWRADQVLYGSYPLNIYCDNVKTFVQDRVLVDETRAKEHGRPIRALVHCCEFSRDSYAPL